MSKGSETTKLSIAVISLKTLRREKDWIPSPHNLGFATVLRKKSRHQNRRQARERDPAASKML
jgi:hypothetical protein